MNHTIVPLDPLERLPQKFFVDPGHESLVAEHYNRYRFCAPFVAGKKVVDAACGIGYGAFLLAQAGAEHVDAIDISPEAIAAARRHYAHPRVRFEARDLLSLSPTGDHDVVVSFETIEHLADTKRYLQVMCNFLKSGGLYFVSTPNRNVSNWEAASFDRGKNPFHVFEWTLEELVRLLRVYFVVEDVYCQRPYYYKGTKIRTVESIFMSKRLRHLLHLPEANYEKLSRVSRIKSYHEPVFFIVRCRKECKGSRN
ncbi:methyltransferase domain-containing protein [candidate division KSB1 bacterium]|nr:methyltransferase domain-containing protein [candidate division KSB1 bacterium]